MKFIQTNRTKAPYLSVADLLKEIIEETGYEKELEAEESEEALSRIENIDELISKAVTYRESADEPSLSGFLEEVALVADIDNLVEGSDYVALMTLHSAKGLEFPNVYLSGMEDGLFPSYMTITNDDPNELEEERRLCYVGITRAKDHLTLTSARMRMTRGETQYNKVSRFVKEIPEELLSGTIYEQTPREEHPLRHGSASAQTQSRHKPYSTTPAKQFGDAGKLTSLDYEVGDRVKHAKFGEGIVTAIASGGRDFEVTVDFDRVGTKKMFASFAKLQKLC